MTIELQRSLLIQAEAAYSEATSDPRRGRVTARAVVEAARTAAAPEALVVALRAAGYAARDLYDHDAAARCLDEAADVARRAHLDERLCEVLITMSATRIELGQPQQARRDLREARAAATPRLRPEVDFAEALLEDTAGNLAGAAKAYRSALGAMSAGHDVLRVKTLNNLALIVTMFGHYDEAERLLEEAIDLASSRWKAREAVATESFATVAVESGRPVEALRRYERAEQLLTEVGVQLMELYRGKARALLTLRLLDEAADAAARAVAQVDGRPGGSLMLAEALLPQARIALAQHRLDDAIAVASRAERLFRRQRRTGWRAEAALLRAAAQAQVAPDSATVTLLERVERTMSAIGNVPGVVESAYLQGEVCVALGRVRKAGRAFTRAAAAVDRGPTLLRLQAYRAKARKAELDGDMRRLGQICRRGLDELSAYRATLASAELRSRAAAHGMSLAEIGLRAAVQSRRPEQVWAWIERSSAVAFVGGPSPSHEGLWPLLAQLRAVERDLGRLPPDAPGRAGLLSRVAALERRIRRASWTASDRSDRWTSPSVRALRRLRADLDGRVLLQYATVGDDLWAVTVRDARIRVFRLGTAADVQASGRRLGFALRRMTQRHVSAASRRLAHDSARYELSHMSDLLVAAVAHEADAADEIVVAAPRQLIGIPWGSLPPLAGRPVRIVPSAMSWWLTRLHAPVSARVVLVAGPELEHAAREVRDVAECHTEPAELAGSAATSEAVRDAAQGAALVHVAAHGRLRSDSPTFSSIQLADGPLTVHDLEGMSAPAHRWVLATCDLGRPGTLAGPALEGVLASLLSGGSAAVIAATVSVPDLDTRHVMVELHRCLAVGESTSEALRRARSAVDPSTPDGFVAGVAFSCYGGG